MTRRLRAGKGGSVRSFIVGVIVGVLVSWAYRRYVVAADDEPISYPPFAEVVRRILDGLAKPTRSASVERPGIDDTPNTRDD